jgi:hypothetical protein
MRPKLTYANVISTLSLFLLLGGGAAFAASHLRKNSVGTKQIKNNAVTLKKIKKNSINSAKVKPNSLTGKNINLNTLGTVPSAEIANGLAALEPTHVVGAPGEPEFQHGDTNAPSGVPGFPYPPAGFYKDHEGIVHLVGGVAIGVEGAIFTLPPGYRPAQNTWEPSLSGLGIAGSGVNANVGATISEGDVWTSSNSPEIDTLSGITFRAES